MRFTQKLSNLELWCLLTTYRKLCNWAFQRTHYWIPKIQDGWDPPSWQSTWCHLFSAEGGQIWIKFWRLVQNDMLTGDVVEIETRCRIPIWRTFGQIQWHVIPEPPAALLGAATWRIQCHDCRATCHIAGCCHWANSMACHPRPTYHIAGCCHFVNSLSRFHSHMPHCRVQSPGEINVMIVPHCRV